MIAAVLILVGWLLSLSLAPRAGLAARVGTTLFFGLTIVPFVALQIALTVPMFMSPTLLLAVGVVCLAGLILVRRGRVLGEGVPSVDRVSLAALGVGAFAGLVFWRIHSDVEIWLALTSWLTRGEAECFYMLSFRWIEGVSQGVPPSEMRSGFEILSTPGNAVLTTGWLPALGLSAFRFLHAVLAAICGLFSVLLLKRWSGSLVVASVASVFAVANPFILQVEVLDRNAMVYFLTPVLLYLLEVHRERAFLHGWLLGWMGGMGLRFLPLTFLLPVGLLYVAWKRPWKAWLLLGLGVGIGFALNLPHLSNHGFHSIGETEAFPMLAGLSVLEGLRTPHLPQPNAVISLRSGLAHLGLFGAGLALFGAIRMARRAPLRTVVLLLLLVPTYVVVAFQRDWLEFDKSRILLTGWWAISAFLAVALGGWTTSAHRGRRLLGVVACVLCVAGAGAWLSGIAGVADPGTADRRPVYPEETEAYRAFLAERYAPAGILPGYALLGPKLDSARKRNEALWTQSLVVPGLRDSDAWEWIAPHVAEGGDVVGTSDSLSEIVLDLEKLVTDPDHAVTRGLEATSAPFVDLTDRERLLDVYYKEVDVSWQGTPLTVTVSPLRGEVAEMGELMVNLNAFVGFGADTYGFEQVNAVHFLHPSRRRAATQQPLLALPQQDPSPLLRLKVPSDVRVLVRNWLVDLRDGTPYRVDGWSIDPVSLEVEFVYGEPESYL